MLTRRAVIGSFLATPFLAPQLLAETPVVFSQHGLALGGSDPVAYFRKGKVVAGHAGLTVMWRGAVWCFESLASRDAFERNPRAFAPQYGGYCAMALTQGVLAPSDPEAWAIHEDRLYLNHSMAARERWLSDPATHIRMADQNWSSVLNG